VRDFARNSLSQKEIKRLWFSDFADVYTHEILPPWETRALRPGEGRVASTINPPRTLVESTDNLSVGRSPHELKFVRR